MTKDQMPLLPDSNTIVIVDMETGKAIFPVDPFLVDLSARAGSPGSPSGPDDHAPTRTQAHE